VLDHGLVNLVPGQSLDWIAKHKPAHIEAREDQVRKVFLHAVVADQSVDRGAEGCRVRRVFTF
jgi:hypothetical protein